ncbi:MAG: M3 family metallopeptidase, partial [Steroidobacteraceae bacterium]
MTTALLSAASAAPATNPLLQPWKGPHGGVPPFDVATPALLAPALETGMAEHLAELEAIANNSEAPTFANTIAAMERSGRALDRASTVYYIYSSSLSDEAVQEVERNIEPKMAAFRDRITQNEKLFARIAKVYETRETSGLTAEEQRLTWLIYTNFVRAGAKLDAASKKRLGEINQSLAGLFTRFSQNLLADESQQYLVLQSSDELAGLPDSLRAGFAADAKRRGQEGKWVVANTRSSVEPFLTYSTRRDLREKVWRTFVNRGDNGDARDNNAIISEILQLRAERARLLGFPTHAHWRLENSMARTPERAMELMEAVWKPAVARVKEEVADMQALADTEGAQIRIEPWDYRFYAEKVRKAKYDLDTNELKPYLQLEKLREGMFSVAEELFAMRFTELAAGTVPVYHPDVRVWRVERTDGRFIGLFYFDPFARVGKQSGAWMNAYRTQERFDGEVTTIVSNNSNFVKGEPGKPALISWDDAVT